MNLNLISHTTTAPLQFWPSKTRHRNQAAQKAETRGRHEQKQILKISELCVLHASQSL